jgi:hypothetical protein
MNRDCEFNLADDASEFAVECSEQILEVNGQEESVIAMAREERLL